MLPQQVPPPLPPPVSPARTAPPAAAWIAWFVAWSLFAVARVVLFVLSPGADFARSLGEMVGNLAVALVLPAMLAWGIWRLCRRSVVAGNLAFFAIFGLMVTVQMGQAARKLRAGSELEKLESDRREFEAEQRKAVANGGEVDREKSAEFTDRAAERMRKMARDSSSEERGVVEAGQAYIEQVSASLRRYNAAVAKIGMDTFFDFKRLRTTEQIAEQRKAVEAFAAAAAEMRTLTVEGAGVLQREMDKRHVPAEQARRAISGYDKSIEKRLPLVRTIRETDEQFAKTMGSFLDLAEATIGAWKIDDGTGNIIFRDDDTVKRYNDLLAEARDIGARQAAAQKQAYPPEPAK